MDNVITEEYKKDCLEIESLCKELGVSVLGITLNYQKENNPADVAKDLLAMLRDIKSGNGGVLIETIGV